MTNHRLSRCELGPLSPVRFERSITGLLILEIAGVLLFVIDLALLVLEISSR